MPGQAAEQVCRKADVTPYLTLSCLSDGCSVADRREHGAAAVVCCFRPLPVLELRFANRKTNDKEQTLEPMQP